MPAWQRRALVAAILVAAAGLRFWGLSTKPAWLDEAITMLLAAGRGPEAVPLGAPQPLAWVASLFAPVATGGYAHVVALLRDPAVQHTHPPLFYLIVHAVLSSNLVSHLPLTTIVRLVSALFGIGAVTVMYFAARDLFDDRTALLAAALSAVSPFGVMLSQEARNYTIAILLVTITTWTTVAIARRMAVGQSAAVVWFVWTAASILSWYSHYFSVLASGAQVLALADAARRHRSFAALRTLAICGAIVAAAFLPWILVLRAHLSSPEQEWMIFHGPTAVAIAIGETFIAWHQMLIGRPWIVQAMPELREPTRIFGIVFIAWVLILFVLAMVRLVRGPDDREPVRVLTTVTALIVAEYALAMIVGSKDLVTEVRYHFPYYPGGVMLLARVLNRLPARSPSTWGMRVLQPSRAVAIVAISALNGALVSAEVEDWKPPETAAVVARFDRTAPLPVAAIVGVGTYHELVNALAYFLEWSREGPLDGRCVALIWREHRRDEGHRADAFIDGVEGLRFRDPPRTLYLHDNEWPLGDYPRRVTVAQLPCDRQAYPAGYAGVESDFANPIYHRYRCGR